MTWNNHTLFKKFKFQENVSCFSPNYDILKQFKLVLLFVFKVVMNEYNYKQP